MKDSSNPPFQSEITSKASTRVTVDAELLDIEETATIPTPSV